MAVTTKKLFSATTNATTTVFSPVGIQLNNQDDLDVYVTLSGGTRVLQLRQSTGSTAQSSHPQVNNTDGLYFPAVTAGTTLYNYTLSTDNNTITFNSALPQGAVVFCERRTRDADSSYTTFASGSTIRATDLNNSSTESNFTAQDGRNKALTIEGVLFRGDQPSTNFVTSDHIVAGTIVTQDIANDAVNADKIADDVVNSEHYAAQSIDTEHIALENITTALIAGDAIVGSKIADNAVDSEHYTDGSIDHEHLANDIIDGDNIQNDVINSEHYVAGSIDHEHLANDIIDGDNIQDSVINSEHYVDGSIDREHLAADIVDGTKIADDSINSEHIAAGALDNEHYAAGSITSDKLNGATVITAAEQGSATANDTSFLTSAAADARYFNVSTGDTIKDGDTFPDNDTTIATTAAINDRIIDLVEEVGGFVPIANETSFPTANPDINNGTGTLVSIKSISSTRTPSSGTVTIANGAGSGNTVSITGCGSTVLTAGFGVIVETTSTLHTYAFHRLVPKATEVTTVAGKATEIGRLGTAAAVEDMSILGTTDVVADMAILGTADVVSDMNTLATADIVSDMNTLAVTDVINDMDTVATNVTNVNNVGGSIANVNTTAGSIANVNTVAGSIANVNTTAGSISNVNSVAGSIANVNTTANNLANVNNFAATYQIASSAPSTDGAGNALAAGDLYFDTSANELRVHNGSTFQGGVTATGNLAGTGANTFTGNQTIQNNLPKLLLTDANNNSDFSVQNANGVFTVHDETNTADRLTINSAGLLTVPGNLDANGGLDVTGNITVTGNVDGRDVAADGSKLDGIETGATADQTASDIKTLLASDKLTSTHLAQDSVSSTQIANDSITVNELANNSVGNSHIIDGTIANAEISGSAAIAGTKISPDFGSQNIVTTGSLSTGQHVTLSGENPHITFTDTNHNPDYEIYGSAGNFKIWNSTANESRLTVNSDGHIDIPGNLDCAAGVDVTGNITVTGTVDGRDIATDGTKLDGIEALATADQTASEIKTLLQSDKLTNSEIADNTVGADQLAHTSVTAGSYGSATAIPAITVDAQGRITAASTNTVNTTTNLSTTTSTGSVTVNSSTGNNATIGVATGSAAGVMSVAFHDKLAGIEVGATADQSNDEIRAAVEAASDSNVFTDADHSKLNGIASSANNYSHPNHSGEVTSSGDGAMTIADNVVDEANLKVSNSPVNGYMLTAQSGNTGGLTWAPAAAGATGSGNDEIFWENGTNVTTDYTITNGKNAGSFGPITIDSGVTVTVGSGETWTVV